MFCGPAGAIDKGTASCPYKGFKLWQIGLLGDFVYHRVWKAPRIGETIAKNWRRLAARTTCEPDEGTVTMMSKIGRAHV